MNTCTSDNDCTASVEKAPLFEPLVPNQKTIAAMKEAHRSKLPSFGSIDEFMADLNAED